MRRLKRLLLLLILAAVGGVAYDRFGRAPSAAHLERLREERRLLNERLQEHLDAEVLLPEAPGATVIFGIPSRLAERFAREAATSLLSEVRLTVRDIDIRKSGELRGRILIGKSELGRFDLELHLDEVNGVLRAGRPELRFEGRRVGVVLPLALAEGAGKGVIRFSWDGRGVAGAVCGDLKIEGPITGQVIPASYSLRGGFTLATEGPAIVARPEFDDMEIELHVEPSGESWQLVEAAMQRQGALCRTALKAADVPERIRGVVDRGFRVKLPKRLLPEIRLPVEMEPSVDMEGTPVHFQIQPAGLTLTRNWLWYGAAVRLVDLLLPASVGPLEMASPTPEAAPSPTTIEETAEPTADPSAAPPEGPAPESRPRDEAPAEP